MHSSWKQNCNLCDIQHSWNMFFNGWKSIGKIMQAYHCIDINRNIMVFTLTTDAGK